MSESHALARDQHIDNPLHTLVFGQQASLPGRQGHEINYCLHVQAFSSTGKLGAPLS